MRAPRSIAVEVVLAWPQRQWRVRLLVAPGCTARRAVALAREAGLDTAGVDAERGPLGVFGESVDDDHALEDGDRVELYRPLRQDPK